MEKLPELEVAEHDRDNFETLNGLLTSLLDHVPADNEKAVMTDCYKFLNEFNQPPHGDAAEWWERAAEELSVLGVKHKNHPLALTVGPAVYEYLEQKCKAINRRYGK